MRVKGELIASLVVAVFIAVALYLLKVGPFG